MLNLAVQLQALYQGRKEDVAGLLKQEEGGDGAVEGGGRVGVVGGRLLGEGVAAAGRVGGAGAGKGGRGC